MADSPPRGQRAGDSFVRYGRIATLVLVVLAQGCSTLASKEAMVACQAGDAITTAKALKLGATETGLVASSLSLSWKGWGLVRLIAFKAGVAIGLWYAYDHMSDATRATATVVSCSPIVGNIKTIKAQRDINSEFPCAHCEAQINPF